MVIQQGSTSALTICSDALNYVWYSARKANTATAKLNT